MLRGILPKEYAFYDYFEKLMKINLLISEEFVSIAEGKVPLENAYRTIKYHERESDKISHDCIDLLHKTFITPIDRDQIYELIKGLDDFADQIDAATFRLTYYDIEELRPDVQEFARVIHAGNIELEQAVKGLVGQTRDVEHVVVAPDDSLGPHGPETHRREQEHERVVNENAGAT